MDCTLSMASTDRCLEVRDWWTDCASSIVIGVEARSHPLRELFLKPEFGLAVTLLLSVTFKLMRLALMFLRTLTEGEGLPNTEEQFSWSEDFVEELIRALGPTRPSLHEVADAHDPIQLIS